jgi:hypothetical protein
MMPSFLVACNGIGCQVNRLFQNQKTGIPAWEDIKFITKDLTNVLDNFVENDDAPIPAMRTRLARTIAEMRDEKGVEDRMMRPAAVPSDPYISIRKMALDCRQRLKEAMLRR